MNFLFFDCETLGLPANYRASYEEVDNWPRVIELAWILTDETGKTIDQFSGLVKPQGWEILPESFSAQNGFTQEKNELEGFHIEHLLCMFKEAKEKADYLFAHNLNFDHRVVWAEFIRAKIEPRREMKKICTMMKGTHVTCIPGTRGYKWPKLVELYTHLFGDVFKGAHGAMADATACKECFFKMLQMGVFPEIYSGAGRPVAEPSSTEPNPDAF